MAEVLPGWAAGLIVMVLMQQSLFTPTLQAADDCFKSVFAFGDGMFDTGSISNVFPSMLNYDYPPYGSTYFGKPSGRFSDGRLVLDFLTESLALPSIPSYAQTVSSDFSSGVSFASAFSTIGRVSTGQQAGPFMFLNPFAIGVQLLQYIEFKSTTFTVIKKASNPKRSLLQEAEAVESTLLAKEAAMARLPAGSEFTRGLYLVSTGSHDIINMYNLNHSAASIESKFPALLDAYHLFVRSLAKVYGVKNIIVFDVEPLGCQPFLLTLIPHTPEELDVKGCLIATNALVQKFNKQLKTHVESWRSGFKANIVFLSQYDIKIDMLKDAAAGFSATNVACCGVPANDYNILIPVSCGGPPMPDPNTKATLVAASACKVPSTHVYWDGFYTTEAANEYVTKKILSGDYFDVPFEALTSCAKPLS